MHVKDLIVTGDARILGKLYTDAELGGGSGGGEASGNYTLSKSGSTISLLRDGNPVSSVQDSDTVSSYSHPEYGALTGKPTGKLTPGHGDIIEVSQVKTDNLGHVTALTTQQIQLPSLGSYSTTGHTHDDRYYTESEVNNLLAGKQAAGSYAPSSHTHDYAPSSHTHNYAGSSSAGGAANSAAALTGGAYVMVSSSEPTNSNCMIWVKTS